MLPPEEEEDLKLSLLFNDVDVDIDCLTAFCINLINILDVVTIVVFDALVSLVVIVFLSKNSCSRMETISIMMKDCYSSVCVLTTFLCKVFFVKLPRIHHCVNSNNFGFIK